MPVDLDELERLELHTLRARVSEHEASPEREYEAWASREYQAWCEREAEKAQKRIGGRDA